MKKILTIATGVISTLFLFSCATLNEQQCKTGNWEEIGRQDGSSGFSASRIASHNKACHEHGVQVSPADYQKGYDAGARDYCTPENGYRLGRSGMMSTQTTCPADLASSFSSAIQKGYSDYQKDLAAREAERKAREIAGLRSF